MPLDQLELAGDHREVSKVALVLEQLGDHLLHMVDLLDHTGTVCLLDPLKRVLVALKVRQRKLCDCLCEALRDRDLDESPDLTLYVVSLIDD